MQPYTNSKLNVPLSEVVEDRHGDQEEDEDGRDDTDVAERHQHFHCRHEVATNRVRNLLVNGVDILAEPIDHPT